MGSRGNSAPRGTLGNVRRHFLLWQSGERGAPGIWWMPSREAAQRPQSHPDPEVSSAGRLETLK